ncbi:TM2 domain-containing protein 2-like [Apostichopus japonicus]|uniref:TM2 domain-containing protein 2-like n=1 Tax=Stichopus japonicus TaxID=307972 RepID=UPI003AB388A5
MDSEVQIIVCFFTFGLIAITQCEVYDGTITVDEGEDSCFDEYCGVEFSPYSPLIKCEYLPEEFYECDDPLDVMLLNISGEGTTGCQFDQEKADKDELSNILVNCTAFPGIECYGDRTFQKEIPCIKFGGHHFVTILLFSVFLGFIGLDRFCLGHIPTAVGKLVTIGGLGVWWIIDVVLLVTGQLQPKDGSSWCP